MALIIRAQTLALQPSDALTHDDLDCRVLVCVLNKPVVDLAGLDGAAWAPLSKDFTIKFQYKQPKAGHYSFADQNNPIELRVLARRREQPDDEWQVGQAALPPPAS